MCSLCMRTEDKRWMRIMPKERITNVIKEILDAEYGFEIYVAMKNGDQIMKKFVLDEGDPNNGIRDSIENTIRIKYLSDDSQYASGDDLANEQNRFYVIAQDDDYQPFAYLSMPEAQLESFRLEDKENADALLFKFILQQEGHVKQFWAYQKILPSSIPNKKKQQCNRSAIYITYWIRTFSYIVCNIIQI